jgi:hypothetical protein
VYRSTTAHSLSDSHPNDATLLDIPSINSKIVTPTCNAPCQPSLPPLPARFEKNTATQYLFDRFVRKGRATYHSTIAYHHHIQGSVSINSSATLGRFPLSFIPFTHCSPVSLVRLHNQSFARYHNQLPVHVTPHRILDDLLSPGWNDKKRK